MILDSVLIALGVKADPKPAEDMSKAIDKVTDSAEKAEVKTSSFGARLSASMRGALAIVSAAAVGVKTALAGAWAFFNSYIDKAEELYESKDKDLKITKAQLDLATKYKERMSTLGKTIDSVRGQIAFAFLPTMNNMAKGMQSLISDNRELIVNGLSKLLEMLAKVGQVITNTIKFINLIVTSTIGWKAALIALAVVFGVVRRAMLLAFITNPVTWVIAAIAGLILLIDDFMTYLNGGESQFGNFWKPMVEWIKIVSPMIKDLWNSLVNGAKAAMPYILAIAEYMVTQFNNVKNYLVGIFEFISALWNGNADDAEKALAKIWGSFLSFWGNLLMGMAKILWNIGKIIVMAFVAAYNGVVNHWDGIKAFFAGIVTGIGNIFSTVGELIVRPFERAIEYVKSKIGGLSALFGGVTGKMSVTNSIGSTVAQGSRTTTNQYNSNTKANIVVNGASNPHQTAATINRAISPTAKNNFMGAAKA